MRNIFTVVNAEYQRYIAHFTSKSDTHVKIHYHDKKQVSCVERCVELNKSS